MRGIYIAFGDGNYVPFSSEKDALKYAIANTGFKVGYVAFGQEFSAKNVPGERPKPSPST